MMRPADSARRRTPLRLALAAGMLLLLGPSGAGGQNRQDDPVSAAREALAAGEADTALRLMRRLTRQQPENVAGWMMLGRSYLALMDEGFREARAQNAVRAFDRAAELNPSQTDLYFLRGRAFLEGLGDSTRAGSEFERQLQVEPGHTEALVRLLEVATDLQEWELAEELAATALVEFAGEERVYRPLLKLYLTQEEWSAAALVARRYLAILGPEGRDMIADLSPLLATDEAERYRAVSPTERSLYERRYWARRGGNRLDGISHRYLEHIWRVAEARSRFSRPDRRAGIRTELLIRYGPPQYLVTSTSGLSLNMILDGEFQSRWRQLLLDLQVPMGAWDSGDYTSFFNPDFEPPRGASRFEFWIYRREGMFFHFIESTAGSGFQLSSGSGDLNAALKSRRPVSSHYEEDMIPLEPAFRIAQFQAGTGRTLVQAAFSLPVVELLGTTSDSLPAVDLLSEVVLTDAAGRVVHDAERNREVTASEATRTQRALRFVEGLAFELEPGKYRLSAFLADRATGRSGTVDVGSVTIRDFSGPGLTLSDLVVAAVDSPGTHEQNLLAEGLTYLPQPAAIFDRERPFRLCFEIYHLARDTTGTAVYDLTVEIYPEQDARTLPEDIVSSSPVPAGAPRPRPVVAVTTTHRTPAHKAVHRPELSLSESREGLYRLRVTVHDRIGESEAAREILFLVLDTSLSLR